VPRLLRQHRQQRNKSAVHRSGSTRPDDADGVSGEKFIRENISITSRPSPFKFDFNPRALKWLGPARLLTRSRPIIKRTQWAMSQRARSTELADA
jgi:hypothetical protein